MAKGRVDRISLARFLPICFVEILQPARPILTRETLKIDGLAAGSGSSVGSP